MREELRNPLRIEHMKEAIDNIRSFMKEKTLEDLQNDKLLFYGVVKNIEILGEAAFMLTNDFKEAHNEIPWKEIIGMRHVLVHDYYQIDPIRVYKVYEEDLPFLSQTLNTLKL